MPGLWTPAGAQQLLDLWAKNAFGPWDIASTERAPSGVGSARPSGRAEDALAPRGEMSGGWVPICGGAVTDRASVGRSGTDRDEPIQGRQREFEQVPDPNASLTPRGARTRAQPR